MQATVRLVLLTAARDRLFTGLFVLLAITAALSLFLGGTAINEQLQTSLVVAAGTGRMILVLGLTIFTAFHVQALFELREVEAILARSISRAQFVLAYWVGLASLALIVAGTFSAAVAFAAGNHAGAILWGATLIAECVIVVGVALFSGLMLERATSTVLFTLGFYALSRLMGFLAGISDTASDLSPLTVAVKYTLDLVLLFVPRLDLFAQSRWLLYKATQAELVFAGAQSALFLVLVLGAAAFDLRRKQF